MNVQTKIACMLAGITILFLCSVLGIRYYLIYNNLNLFEISYASSIDLAYCRISRAKIVAGVAA